MASAKQYMFTLRVSVEKAKGFCSRSGKKDSSGWCELTSHSIVGSFLALTDVNKAEQWLCGIEFANQLQKVLSVGDLAAGIKLPSHTVQVGKDLYHNRPVGSC